MRRGIFAILAVMVLASLPMACFATRVWDYNPVINVKGLFTTTKDEPGEVPREVFFGTRNVFYVHPDADIIFDLARANDSDPNFDTDRVTVYVPLGSYEEADGSLYCYWWLFPQAEKPTDPYIQSPYNASYSSGSWVTSSSQAEQGFHSSSPYTQTFTSADRSLVWYADWHVDDYGYHDSTFGFGDDPNAWGGFIIIFDQNQPMITYPVNMTDQLQPTIVWEVDTSVTYTKYQLEVVNVDGPAYYWSSGEVVSSATHHQVGSPLANGVTYKARVRVNDGSHSWWRYWSEWKYFKVETDPSNPTPVIDFGLPTTNLNQSAGVNRSNIRWSANNSGIFYGDDFTLPAGPNWIVDSIVVWAVPEVDIAPMYFLGDHYSAIEIYHGAVGSSLQLGASGTLTTGSDVVTGADITVTPVTYAGSINYETAPRLSNQIWQIKFDNLNWNVPGGASHVFGVRGLPRVDRMWFNHSANVQLSGVSYSGADGSIRKIDVNDLNAGSVMADGSGWFDGKGADINVQVFARPQ